MKLDVVGQPDWDPLDPVNAGIQSVELVAGGAGVPVRRIPQRLTSPYCMPHFSSQSWTPFISARLGLAWKLAGENGTGPRRGRRTVESLWSSLLRRRSAAGVCG